LRPVELHKIRFATVRTSTCITKASNALKLICCGIVSLHRVSLRSIRVGGLFPNDRSCVRSVYSVHTRRIRSLHLRSRSRPYLSNLQFLHAHLGAASFVPTQPHVEAPADAAAVQLPATWSAVQDSRGAVATSQVQQVWLRPLFLRCNWHSWKLQPQRRRLSRRPSMYRAGGLQHSCVAHCEHVSILESKIRVRIPIHCVLYVVLLV
jgi:hypothetical protein